MATLTPFGEVMRDLRLNRDLTLRGVARLLGVSPSFLSGMEVGTKPVPESIVPRLVEAMQMTDAEEDRLREAVVRTNRKTELRVRQGAPRDEFRLAQALARKFNDGLTSPEISRLWKALEDE